MDIIVSKTMARVPVTVFKIRGEINAHTGEQLQTQGEAAHSAGARNLVLDLSEATYISSAGIRVLNHLFKLYRGQDADEAISQGVRAGTYKSPHLKLAGPSTSVRKTLSMAGVDMFLEMHADLQSALASF
jgi:anti-anti-sigma factor